MGQSDVTRLGTFGAAKAEVESTTGLVLTMEHWNAKQRCDWNSERCGTLLL